MADTRKTWSSRIGFVLASAGAAVGLGAIWKFPYMVGTNGGSAFVFPYILMTFTVGLVLLIAEVALGRVGRGGIVTAYRNLGGKAWVPAGYLGVLTGFLVLCFYSAIGGWTLSYFCDALTGTTVMPDQAALGEHFGRLTADPVTAMGFQWLFLLLNGLILALDVTKGIERMSKFLMPLLFVLMLILIGRGLTLPGAWDGVEYLFAFRPEAFSWDAMLQAMGFTFFSLCVGCGCMLTYGSYLGKNENLPKNSVIIVISDTMVAIMAGLAVIPAAVANGIAKGMAVSEIKLGGPNLLFATLQDVFHDMGTIGGIFGLIFYALVLIAAISSAISLIEAVSVTFIDHASAKGHERDRNKVLAVVCLAITLLACLVAVDGLGSNGIAPKDLFHINSKADWCADWLDFMDMISEGIAMPLGAMLMSIMVGWEIKPKSLYGEIDSGYNGHIHGFYTFCIKYLCPVIMFFILLVQISTFFGLGWFN